MEEVEESSSSPVKTIFDLGYDNLYEIMSYLSLNDKLLLGLLDNRFDECLCRFLKKDMFRMDEVVMKFRKKHTRQIIERYGSMIKLLCLESMCYKDDSYHELVSTYCKDLRELRCFCSRAITANVSLKLLENSKTLEGLEIFDWSTIHEVSPESILAKLSTLSDLMRLSLSNSDITGKYLRNLTKLKHLNLHNCWKLKSGHFMEICDANKLLTLNISGCTKLDNAAFQTLVETQTDLHEITVGGDYVATNAEIVANLTKLKTFRIDLCEPEKFLRYLTKLAEIKYQSLECIFASHLVQGESYYGYEPLDENIAKTITSCLVQFKKLKELHLPTNSFMNAERLQRIVKACKYLEVLNISGSNMIDVDAICDAVRELKHLHALNICGCVWGKFDVYDRLYKVVENRNTLKLVVYGIYCASFGLFMDSLEYKVRSRYLEVRKDSSRDFLKEKYQKCEIPRHESINFEPAADISRVPNELSLLDLPDNSLKHFVSFLEPVDRLKIVLTHSRFHSLAAESLKDVKVNLNEFIRYFTFNDTRNVLRICSKYMEKITFSFEDGEKPVEYLHVLESYQKDFVVIDVSAYPENYVEDCWFPFD